jgi:competence protein ComEC
VVNKLDENLSLIDRHLDYVLLTHPHADHVAGLTEVLRLYDIGQVIMTGAIHTAPDYLDFLNLIKEKSIPALIIESPQELEVDGTTLKFLAPLKSFSNQRLENLNNSSIVFKLVYGSSTALFTGDYEQEEQLLKNSTDLSSQILKVGHHGSTNANDEAFLQAVRPQYAVISVGKNNSFGHPHYRTIYYLKQLGAEILRTDESGDVSFNCNLAGCQKAD